MAETFLDRDDLGAAVADLGDPDDDPPAVICGGGEAAFAVAHGLDKYAVPTAVVDADATDLAWRSNAVDVAGAVADPTADPEGFRADLASIAERTGEVVALPCSAAATRALLTDVPDDVLVPYDEPEPAMVLLDRELLYAVADGAGVDRPEAYIVRGADGDSPISVETPEVAADDLGYPVECVAAAGSWLADALGADPYVAADDEDLARAVAAAEERGGRLLVRERIDVAEDHRVATYYGEDADESTVEGSVTARRGGRHGRPCLMDVDQVDGDDGIAGAAFRVLDAAGYEGLCATRFVETGDGRTLLVAASPHPTRWLRAVTDNGTNYPHGAYVEATADRIAPDPPRECRWVHAADYLRYLGDGGTDHLTPDQWQAYVGGRFHYAPGLSAAVLHGSDDAPTEGLIRRELGVE